MDRVYARRKHRTILRAVVTVTAGLAWTTLLHIVKTKANRLHCQSGPRAPLVTRPGIDKANREAAATQASNTMAAVNMSFCDSIDCGSWRTLLFRLDGE